jgi:phosphoglycerate dehydrogenase-like enzyme
MFTLSASATLSKGGPTDEVIGFDRDSLHDALARTTYPVIACPLTETTEGLIGAAEFATLPPDAVLVNMARGPIVDTEAMVDAIRGNTIRGAVLDVTDPEPLPEGHPLWNFGNVQITPHNS